VSFESDAEHAVLWCAGHTASLVSKYRPCLLKVMLSLLCCPVLCRSHSQPILKVMLSMLCYAVMCRSHSQPGEQVQAGHAYPDTGHSSAEDRVYEVEAGGACCGSPVSDQQITLPCLGCSLP